MILGATDTFFVNLNAFKIIDIVEDDAGFAANDLYRALLVGIHPTHLDLSKNGIGVEQMNESRIFPAFFQMADAKRVYTKRRLAEQVIEDCDIVRGQIPGDID